MDMNLNPDLEENFDQIISITQLKDYENHIFDAFIKEDWQLIRIISTSLEKEINLYEHLQLSSNLFRLIQLIDTHIEYTQYVRILVTEILQELNNLQKELRKNLKNSIKRSITQQSAHSIAHQNTYLVGHQNSHQNTHSTASFTPLLDELSIKKQENSTYYNIKYFSESDNQFRVEFFILTLALVIVSHTFGNVIIT